MTLVPAIEMATSNHAWSGLDVKCAARHERAAPGVTPVTVVRAALLLLLLGVALPSDSAPVPLSGADAVRAIDWSSVYIGSAIPESMPTADADDTVDAGFAREWLERALVPGRPSLSSLALDIVSRSSSQLDG
jgi:hypothetical protein